MNNDIIILDCTFRDGGYYNNWNFDSKLVDSYLSSVQDSGIHCIELGMRGFPQSRFLGAFAYTSDSYLKQLDIPESIMIGVMIDAKSILSREQSISDSVEQLFQPKQDSPITLVRIASHFSEVEASREIALKLEALGYSVGFNLMQSAGKDNELLTAKAREIQSWNCISVLYFADSLGNMDSIEVHRVVTALKLGWKGDIGIHAHNNQGKAVSNSLSALELGVKWLDSTMLGMGRGAGNSPTETLLLELEAKKHAGLNSAKLYSLILDYFEPLQALYRWGPGLLYNLAAIYNIHPTYIQSMVADNRYKTDEIINALEFMKLHDCSSYRQDILNRANKEAQKVYDGNWDASGWCKGKDILIIGAGPSTEKHQAGLKQYINNNKPTVLCLNLNHFLDQEYVDLYVASEPSRILVEATRYSSLKKPIALPAQRVKEQLPDKLHDIEIKDFGLNISEHTVSIDKKSCVIPNTLAISYALAIGIAGECRAIYLVGLDGYASDDPRQKEMLRTIDLFKQRLPNLHMTSLTPTTYPIEQGSIYAPRFN